jgi:hypothetical protein
VLATTRRDYDDNMAVFEELRQKRLRAFLYPPTCWS